MQEAEAIDIQRYVLCFKRKQRGQLKFDVLSIAKINAEFRKAGIDIHDLSLYAPSDLGKILNVDVVIMGTFETSKSMSNAVGAALALLGGAFFQLKQQLQIWIFTIQVMMNWLSTITKKYLVNRIGCSGFDKCFNEKGYKKDSLHKYKIIAESSSICLTLSLILTELGVTTLQR